jgi:hypothetical protein
VVKASLRASLRVTALSGGGVHREDERPIAGPVAHDQLSHLLGVDLAFRQRLAEAAVAAPERGTQ